MAEPPPCRETPPRHCSPSNSCSHLGPHCQCPVGCPWQLVTAAQRLSAPSPQGQALADVGTPGLLSVGTRASGLAQLRVGPAPTCGSSGRGDCPALSPGLCATFSGKQGRTMQRRPADPAEPASALSHPPSEPEQRALRRWSLHPTGFSDQSGQYGTDENPGTGQPLRPWGWNHANAGHHLPHMHQERTLSSQNRLLLWGVRWAAGGWSPLSPPGDSPWVPHPGRLPPHHGSEPRS